MKTILQRNKRILVLLGLTAFLAVGGTSRSWAYDYYEHDDRGYWDGDHHYHVFEYHHHHRGYWHERNGVRFFININ